jgi:hypothetical protein
MKKLTCILLISMISCNFSYAKSHSYPFRGIDKTWTWNKQDRAVDVTHSWTGYYTGKPRSFTVQKTIVRKK